MSTRLEQSLERDIERIRQQVLEMASLAERSLRDCVRAMVEGNTQLAYAVILRDQYIDEKEKGIDRLCLEFLVRQQPVGAHLRLAYSAIKINLELERVGDYAESVARQLARLERIPDSSSSVVDRIVEMADLAIPMLHDSIQAFVRQDPNLATNVIAREPGVDALLGKLSGEIIEALRSQQISIEMVEPLINIGRRFERVADQARNVCMETIYMCTGEFAKHPGSETLRVLFVGEYNACRSQLAEAIARSLNQPKFLFSSAGIDPRAIQPRTIQFMKAKGLETGHVAPKAIHQVPNLDHYQVVVGVAKEAQLAFPRSPRKTVFIDWSLEDPSRVTGSQAEIEAAYEAAYEFLSRHVRDLVEAVLGSPLDPGGAGAMR